MATKIITCKFCGIQKEVKRQSDPQVFCSSSCFGKSRNGSNASCWRGGRFTRDGYIYILIGDRKYAPEHVLIAEKALGKPLRNGEHPVHHHDENRQNNANGNLVICENNAYHRLLHKRMRVLKSGGDPNTQKICCTCKKPKFFNEFHKHRNSLNGVHGRCRDCFNAIARTEWARDHPRP